MQSRMEWKKVGVVAGLVLALVALAALAYASGGGEGHGGGADKVKDLWLRIMNFAGLVFILWYFLRKPIANGLSGRRQAIQDQFDELDSKRADAERLYKQYETKLSGIDAEIKNIIDAAVEQGEAEKKKIIDEATRAAGDIKRQSEMAIQHELAQATKRLRAEVAEQTAAMAEQIIAKSLQPEDQFRLVEGYLDKVGGVQ